MMAAFLDSILVQGMYYKKNGEMRQKIFTAAAEAALQTKLGRLVAANYKSQIPAVQQ